MHQSVPETPAERTDALVVCNDDGLLIELGSRLGDQFRVHTLDALAGIGEVAMARWIGIVDVDSQPGARSAVPRLELQYPSCPLIVITARPEDWADSVARGAVLAAIARDQIATAQLDDVLLAARDALGRGHGADRFEARPQRRRVLWAAAAVLFATGAAGAWLYHRADLASHFLGKGGPGRYAAAVQARPPADPTPSSSRSGPQTVNAAAPGRQNVLELLSAARIAFRDQRLLPPRAEGEWHGDSALELYAQVLGQDRQNPEALAGVKRLWVLGRSRITTDAAGGELDDATRLLGLFKTAGVDAADVRQLASAIRAARPKWLAQRAAQDIAADDFNSADQEISEALASGADASTVQSLRSEAAAKKLRLQLAAMATQVERAVRAGVLLPPARDNALARLTAMRSIARGHPLTVEAQYEVQVALVQAGEAATRAAQFALAQRDLNAASELGSFAPLTFARRQLQQAKAAHYTARRSAAFTGAGRPGAQTATQVTAGQAGEPGQAAQAGQAAQTAQGTAAREPGSTAGALTAASAASRPYLVARPTRALPVSYPYGFGMADAEGTVIVEFTLSANGSASDVTVVQSDLPSRFDRAAIAAVRRGRYSTDELVDGRPARARIKLRFTTTED